MGIISCWHDIPEKSGHGSIEATFHTEYWLPINAKRCNSLLGNKCPVVVKRSKPGEGKGFSIEISVQAYLYTHLDVEEYVT